MHRRFVKLSYISIWDYFNVKMIYGFNIETANQSNVLESSGRCKLSHVYSGNDIKDVGIVIAIIYGV